MSTLSSDTFTRANNGSNWGTASSGDVWATNVGTPTLSVVSNEGHATNISSQAAMQLGSTTSANLEGLVRVKASATTSTRMGVALRFTASNTFYHGRLSANANNLVIGKVVSGTNTDLFTTAFTVSTGTYYWIKFRVVSTSLFVKAWSDGGSEPGWTLTGTDSSISGAGGFGLTINATSTATTWDFDSFTVTDGVTPYDIRGRFLLSASSLKDIGARFRQQSTRLRDISARFQLSSANQRILNLSSRFRLLSTVGKDVAGRISLQVTRLRDVNGRLRVNATPLKDSATRTRLLASTVKDIRGRLHLSVLRVRDIQGRLRLAVGNVRDVTCRFLLAAPLIVLPSPVVTAYRGIPACLPIPVPTTPYTLGVTLLDTPLLCTGPPLVGGQLLAGSTFILLFQSPSTTTQNALTLGSTGSMQLALADTSIITAPVTVSGNVLVGSLLQVTFTVQTTTPVYSYVTVTQFF